MMIFFSIVIQVLPAFSFQGLLLCGDEAPRARCIYSTMAMLDQFPNPFMKSLFPCRRINKSS